VIIIFFFRGLRCCFDTIMSTVRYVTVRYFAIWHPSSDTVCPDDGILQFFQITAFWCGPRPRYICLPLLNYMFSEVFSVDQPCENRVISYGDCLFSSSWVWPSLHSFVVSESYCISLHLIPTFHMICGYCTRAGSSTSVLAGKGFVAGLELFSERFHVCSFKMHGVSTK
jgi:hypothetical protein